MKVLGKRFLEEYVPVHCKPSTAYEYQRSVKFFIHPRIGTRKVMEIQRSDIAELHHGMRETPYQANRTLGVLSTDIPHIPSKFVEIVPLSHRQGNCIPYAARASFLSACRAS